MNIFDQVRLLQHQIQYFQEMDKRQMSQQELFKEIMRALTIDGRYMLPEKNVRYVKNTDFFRARKLPSNDMNSLWTWNEHDYWEVPAKLVKNFGRLNEPNESIFYTSLNPLQTLNEIRAVDGELVAISRYSNMQELPSVVICPDLSDIEMTEENKILANIRNDFLRVEFTRDVAPGLEHLYRVSNQIVKDNFDLPEEISKAWTYPAIQNKASYNVGMRPAVAHKILNFCGAVVGKAGTHNGYRCITDILLINSQFQPLRATDELLSIIMPNLYKQDQ